MERASDRGRKRLPEAIARLDQAVTELEEAVERLVGENGGAPRPNAAADAELARLRALHAKVGSRLDAAILRLRLLINE